MCCCVLAVVLREQLVSAAAFWPCNGLQGSLSAWQWYSSSSAFLSIEWQHFRCSSKWQRGNMVKCMVQSCMYTKNATQSYMARPWIELTSSHRWLRCFDVSFIAYFTYIHTDTHAPRAHFIPHFRRVPLENREMQATQNEHFSLYFFSFEWHLHKWSIPWTQRGWNGSTLIRILSLQTDK